MEINDKMSGWLKVYTNYAAAIAMCVVYVAISFVRMDATGRTVAEILSDGFLVFVMGVCINSVFRDNGLKLGRAEAEVSRAIADHEAVACEIAPYVGELSEWCTGETARVLRLERMRVLAEESLRYEECFDADGKPIPYEARYIEAKPFRRGFIRAARFNKMETRRAKAAIRAACLKITPMSAGELLSEGHKKGDPFRMGRSKEEFVKQESLRDVVSKVAISLFFGYYGFSMLEEFRPEVLIGSIFQVVLFGVFGLMTQATALDYMRDEFRARMIMKASYLCQFRERTGYGRAPTIAETAYDEAVVPDRGGKEGDGHDDGSEKEEKAA